MHLQVLDFCEDGKRAHFTLNPSSYINMHGGAKDFSVEARYNAIKRFLNDELARLSNTIGKSFSSMNQEKNGNIGGSNNRNVNFIKKSS